MERQRIVLQISMYVCVIDRRSRAGRRDVVTGMYSMLTLSILSQLKLVTTELGCYFPFDSTWRCFLLTKEPRAWEEHRSACLE